MAEYIEREALIDEINIAPVSMSICMNVDECKGRIYERERLVRVINDIPAADVAPVRHGRWVEVEVKELAYYKMMIASMRCDQCGRYHNEVYHYGNPTEMAKYCGFCGALMDKDGDGDV